MHETDAEKERAEDTEKRLNAIKEKIEGFYNRPWELYHEPFRVAGDIYFLGNRYVSSYLVDTGEGLILIDCGFKETLYQLFEGIRTLGFSPYEIKYLFLTHGHVDHCGAARFIQEYCGCRIYIGQGDRFFFTERRDLIMDEERVPEFPIDGSYTYGQPMVIGRTVFHFIHTPGHTPGCTSMLIETTDNGRKLVCGLHGGLGINGLSRGELERNRLPFSLQSQFYKSLLEAKEWKVDVVIPSHNHNYDILSRYREDDGSRSAFIDPAAWREMMEIQIEKLKTIL